MSVATFGNDRAVRGGTVGGPSFFARLASRVKRYVELSRAERELEELDDRLLMDIGLKRSEIRRMVWNGDNA
ncbi:DUF1127 domain-containing protein [Kaustia mangrovi]|uniref:DUF1127 domain-containing protein n=1 Tax=Kaustia mangrovi TaxID=2593653 RepID=A0A7S8C1Y0_9HYPH|nr:DUF1127 domain-containing protein [Kaustia mangrovi]QPC41884.1 DUF1127 domain-containing protein [Kaustia mangrovi]